MQNIGKSRTVTDQIPPSSLWSTFLSFSTPHWPFRDIKFARLHL
jgi:hypothetical protein